MEGVNIILTMMDMLIGVQEQCGRVLACRMRGVREYEITMKTEEGRDSLLEGVRVKGVLISARKLSENEVTVSFMYLPAYIGDGVILERLREWGVEPVSRIHRRKIQGTQVADGTRYLRVLLKGEVHSLPYSTKLRVAGGEEYFSVKHDGQRQVCRNCLKPGHIYRECPMIKCYKCKGEGHRARRDGWEEKRGGMGGEGWSEEFPPRRALNQGHPQPALRSPKKPLLATPPPTPMSEGEEEAEPEEKGGADDTRKKGRARSESGEEEEKSEEEMEGEKGPWNMTKKERKRRVHDEKKRVKKNGSSDDEAAGGAGAVEMDEAEGERKEPDGLWPGAGRPNQPRPRVEEEGKRSGKQLKRPKRATTTEGRRVQKEEWAEMTAAGKAAAAATDKEKGCIFQSKRGDPCRTFNGARLVATTFTARSVSLVCSLQPNTARSKAI
ncbi:uncharacterized protein LOC117533534 isoform X2 [Gymnodraco acuticeps]|uniref:Uncharacterized protein LOC117533534 isoform X2 n=1 Tax=Gymnodraco acuticeps TaxID=8218 RepID=A0A6P8SR37_GYMAC|nr:uncharacterized protein LOC117533534 isoform X2 [Gymnodraco acuticeps]XP_034053213.1 uncharacterized protein LOC117533534 isoform X2 [Gymnodraco acuticeps]XP_034053214.1 uncharacterized protein LOC117533534 isoform X2 [Gymnodraco acuticeps]